MMSLARVLACTCVFGLASLSLAATKYEVDPVHSAVIFRIKHLNVSYSYGRFNDISGNFTLDAENPANSSVEVSVRVDSIDTAHGGRDQHLKSDEYFNVAKHATISFKSSKVEKVGDQQYKAEGELTLLGVSKPLTVTIEHVGEANVPRAGQRSGFETSFTIKRSDFGLTAGMGGLGDDVRLIVSIEGAVPQEEGKQGE